MSLIDEEKKIAREDEQAEVKRKNRKLKRKVIFRNVSIVVLIIIIILLLLRSCSSDGNTKLKKFNPQIESGKYVDDNGEYGTVEAGKTDIPVIEDFTVSKEKPYMSIWNPITNKKHSYLKYIFKDAETGKEIYSSDLVEPGYKFSVPFGTLMDKGSHKVKVTIENHDYNNPEKLKSGATSEIVITIN